MNFTEFRSSLAEKKPPIGLATALRALWLDASGDWDSAHELVDDPKHNVETRVHAYLHRKEGDLSNARYWYAQAGTNPITTSLQKEWEVLVRELLDER